MAPESGEIAFKKGPTKGLAAGEEIGDFKRPDATLPTSRRLHVLPLLGKDAVLCPPTEGAKKIAASVIAECQKNGWNVAVAVVDNHGFLVYFERMDNTQTASLDIAVGKAKSAATYRRPTRAFADVINKGGHATATLPGVFAAPGGLPIMIDGKVTGGVGVSGVTGDQDEQCAKAGLGS